MTTGSTKKPARRRIRLRVSLVSAFQARSDSSPPGKSANTSSAGGVRGGGDGGGGAPRRVARSSSAANLQPPVPAAPDHSRGTRRDVAAAGRARVARAANVVAEAAAWAASATCQPLAAAAVHSAGRVHRRAAAAVTAGSRRARRRKEARPCKPKGKSMRGERQVTATLNDTHTARQSVASEAEDKQASGATALARLLAGSRVTDTRGPLTTTRNTQLWRRVVIRGESRVQIGFGVCEGRANSQGSSNKR